MNYNAALCYLMGATSAPPIDRLAAIPVENEELVLVALVHARAGRLDPLSDVIDLLDERGVAIISSYLLMLGLSGELQLALSVFDVLRFRRPCDAPIWFALARLQAAWNYPLPALRSDAMYRHLTDCVFDGPMLSIQDTYFAAGPVHLLEGDVPAFFRQ